MYVGLGNKDEWWKCYDVTINYEEKVLVDKNGNVFRATGSSAKFLAFMLTQKEIGSIEGPLYISFTQVSVEKFTKDIKKMNPNLMKIVDPTLEIPNDLIQFDNFIEESLISALAVRY